MAVADKKGEINEVAELEVKDYEPEILNIIKLNINKSGAPIRIMQQTQELCGYLPYSALKTISRETDIPLSKLYSIITFYHFFTLVPHGRHIIQVCKGTACYVKGGQKILDYLKREYNLEPGGTTTDRKFSLNIVRCLGCCGLSPVMAVGEDVYRTVKSSQLKDILSYYK
jgi:NADH:ubiquinone oxidoreductase subunit E